MLKNTAAIGADIGRHSISIAVVTYGGTIVTVNSHELPEHQTSGQIISILTEAVHNIRKKVAGQGINPVSIGISAKGFIDNRSGVILGPDQGIEGWNNIPLAKLIAKASGLPVSVENDANLMTIAEHRFGSARNYSNLIFVAMRTGIGGGIIINGKLYRGSNNAGGEIGQMIINFANGISDKGIRGSYEHFASAAALVRRYHEIAGSKADKQVNVLTGRDVFELSYKRNPAALKAVKENAFLAGIGLANLISVFAPEIIVLGGGMSQARESYINMIRKSAFDNSLEHCRAAVKIERAALGIKAALLGSAWYSMVKLAGKTI
ncbi:MAG: ROK family protein [Bacteroidales bacterium]|nr:ROK family protein [Bacteroidales bacterium]MBN2634305.1 ROK family protein [Bacteroidales bacterium]